MARESKYSFFSSSKLPKEISATSVNVEKVAGPRAALGRADSDPAYLGTLYGPKRSSFPIMTVLFIF